MRIPFYVLGTALLAASLAAGCKKDDPQPADTTLTPHCTETVDFNPSGPLNVSVEKGFDASGRFISFTRQFEEGRRRAIVHGPQHYVILPPPKGLGYDSVAFDAEGRVVAHREYWNSQPDPKQWRQHNYIYDATGQLLRYVEIGAQGSETALDTFQVKSYSWAGGNLQRSEVLRGGSAIVLVYGYDTTRAGEMLHIEGFPLFRTTGAHLVATRHRLRSAVQMLGGDTLSQAYFGYEYDGGGRLAFMHFEDSSWMHGKSFSSIRVRNTCR